MRSKRVIVSFIVLVILLIVVVPALIMSPPSKKLHKPTVDISGKPVTNTSLESNMQLWSGNGKKTGHLVIFDREYEIYVLADDDIHTVDALGKNLREPVLKSIPAELVFDGVEAYSIMDWLYFYHAKIKALSSEDWLVSFIENGSQGQLSIDNVKIIWKRVGVIDIPQWLTQFKKECEKTS